MISPADWLQHLERHVPIADAGTDREGVHQVRVAAGRLSVWLQLADRRILRDDLRWLRRSASEVRDLDVVLEREHAPGVEAWMRAQREVRHAALGRALADRRLRAMLQALSWLPGLPEDVARERLAVLKRRVVEAGEKVERHPDDDRALHRLRRKARRLRYALEWFGADVSALKELQDELGALNNDVVLLALLERCPPERGAEDELAALLPDVETRRAGALAAWKSRRAAIEAL